MGSASACSAQPDHAGGGIRRTLAVFLAVMILGHVLWVVILVARVGGVQRQIIVTAFYVVLALLPPAAARCWPRVASFDRSLWPSRERGRVWPLCLLLLIAVAWFGAAVLLGRLLPPVVRPRLSLLGKSVADWVDLPALILTQASIAVFLGSVAQEIFWRGWALDMLQKVMGRWWALLVQAVLFAAVHQGSASNAHIFLFGLAAGWWRQRYRALIPLMLLHVGVNAVIVAPQALRTWQEFTSLRSPIGARTPIGDQVYTWQPSDKDLLRSLGIDTAQTYRDIADSPECREIDALASKRGYRGVPGIIEFLGSEDDTARLYAEMVLVEVYGKKGAPWYRKALGSDNNRVVEGVLRVIRSTKCHELTPDVRELAWTTDDLRVQISVVIELSELKDVEGLRRIASEHPSERVRRAAKTRLADP